MERESSAEKPSPKEIQTPGCLFGACLSSFRQNHCHPACMMASLNYTHSEVRSRGLNSTVVWSSAGYPVRNDSVAWRPGMDDTARASAVPRLCDSSGNGRGTEAAGGGQDHLGSPMVLIRSTTSGHLPASGSPGGQAHLVTWWSSSRTPGQEARPEHGIWLRVQSH